MSTILVVDDVSFFRNMVVDTLHMAGYVAVGAAGAKEAMEVLSYRAIDLLILDIEMPEVPGLALLRKLHESNQWRHLPVIMLTGTSDRNVVLEARRAGAAEYLLKTSFSAPAMLERVKHCLGGGAGDAPAAGHGGPVNAAQAADQTIGLPSDPSSPADVLKRFQPLLTRDQLVDNLGREDQLKAFASTVAQLISAADDPNCSIDRLVGAIRQDHVLAMKFLQLANSVIYTRGEPVESLHSAVTRIGVRQVRQTAFNIGVIDAFSREDAAASLSVAHFWEHSIACGLIAAEIVHVLGGTVEEADAVFTLGLLHDIGRLIIAQRWGDAYRQTLAIADQLQLPLEQVETRLLTMNHADFAERVLTAWRLPRHLVGPIARHHQTSGNHQPVVPANLDHTSTLILADRLAHALLLGNSGNLTIYPTQNLIRALGLTAIQVQQIIVKVPDQVHDMKLALLSRSPQAWWPSLADQLRRHMRVPLRPLFISREAPIDAVGMFVGNLADVGSGENPNIGIVHISHEEEREGLGHKLQAAEAEAGVGPLPLLIISSTGRLALEAPAQARRPVGFLIRPFQPGRFIEAVRELMGGGEG